MTALQLRIAGAHEGGDDEQEDGQLQPPVYGRGKKITHHDAIADDDTRDDDSDAGKIAGQDIEALNRLRKTPPDGPATHLPGVHAGALVGSRAHD